MLKANIIARSLREAATHMGNVRELILTRSEDLMCRNLMCERVGESCVCRLSLVLEKMPQLEKLDISYNNLVRLPPKVFDLKSLQELDISGNALTDEVFKNTMHEQNLLGLSQLQILRMEDNCLTAIPTDVTKLEHLKEVFAKGNPLIKTLDNSNFNIHV